MEDENGQRIGRTDAHLAHTDKAVAELRIEIHELRLAITALGERFSATGKINWPVVLSGIAVVITLISALYVAAIRPVSLQLDRLEQDRIVLTQTTVLHTGQISDMNTIIVARGELLSAIQDEITRIRQEGSPITAARLAVIEDRLKIIH